MKGDEIHVFDLDHTLVNGNLSFLFGRYLYKEGLISSYQAAALSFFYLAHKLRFIKVETVHYNALKTIFLDFDYKLLSCHVDNFLNAELDCLYKAELLNRLNQNKSLHDLCILSSSPDFIVAKVASKLSVPLFGSTLYSVDKDQKICDISLVMEGSSKAKFLKSLPHQKKVFYTDHSSDLEVCEIANHVVAVNPDRKLRNRARQAGWEIIDESSFSSDCKHKK